MNKSRKSYSETDSHLADQQMPPVWSQMKSLPTVQLTALLPVLFPIFRLRVEELKAVCPADSS